MRFTLLGDVQVLRPDGAPVHIGGERVRSLLALLALEPGKVMPTDTLVDALWGEHPPAKAANALQSLVRRLRAALGTDLVQTTAAGYLLDVGTESVDTCRFARLVVQAREASAAGDDETALVRLRAALALWRGPALAALTDSQVLAAAASRLTEQRLVALEDLAQAHLTLGRAAEIVDELTAQTVVHPLRERLGALHMRVLAACGRSAEALQFFERIRKLLAEELGVDPGPILAAAHLEILRAGSDNVRAARTPTNLRGQLTSFVGREEELARIATLLAETRLVTLVGPGGAGKTRLAVEAANRMADRWPDGTWLVELARVVDPGAVPYAVLAGLGIRDNVLTPGPAGPVADPAAQLAGVLGGKRLLLIVDNCEHVLDSVAPLIDGVLARCPGVGVLTASREPLGITGETLCRVPPLGVPTAQATTAEVADATAVRLFTDRARAVHSGFTLDASNSAVVGAICRRLDGMPLAIELAAARLRALTPEQIADRLDDRFRLLTGGNRAALPRHQTLRAVVDWSWGLLTDAEKDLARQMSVFAGGATLDSVTKVCGGDRLEALLSLVDKSLVEAEDGRFRMLETIRAYGAEQLRGIGSQDRLNRAHAHYFLELAESAVPKMRTAEQLTWIGRLAAEHDNCVAALGWAVDSGETEIALRLCGSLTWYWQLRGFRAEALHWSRQVLALAGDEPPPGLTGAYLACEYATGLAEFVGMVGFDEPVDRPGGSARVRQRLAVALAEGDVHPLLRILACSDGEFADFLVDDDPWVVNTALLMRGSRRMNNAQHRLAEQDLEAAVAGFRRLGERRGLSRALLTLATFRTRAEGAAAARDLMTEAADLVPEWVSGGEAVSVLTRLAHLRAWDGDVTGGAEAVARARERVTIGVPTEVLAQLRLTEADLRRRAGDITAVLPVYEEVLATLTTSEQTVPLDAVWAHTSYAMALAEARDLSRAHDQLRHALERTLAVPDVPVLIAVSVGFAVAAMAAGDAEAAVTLIEAGAGHHDHRSRGGPDVARVREYALAELGPQRCAQIRRQVASMSPDDIVALLQAAVNA